MQTTQTTAAHFERGTTGVDRSGDRKPRRTLATPEFPVAEGSSTRSKTAKRGYWSAMAMMQLRRSADSVGHAAIKNSRSESTANCSACAALCPEPILISDEFESFRVLSRPLIIPSPPLFFSLQRQFVERPRAATAWLVQSPAGKVVPPIR